MKWFTEDPTLVIICGTIICIALGIAIFKTGRVIFIVWLLLAAFTTVGLVILERVIVTDREKIEMALIEGADAVSRNDIPKAMKLLSTSQAKTVQQVQSNLKRYRFSEAYIVLQNTELEKSNSPTHAIATITARISETTVPYAGMIKVQLHFVREGDQWLVEDYELVQ